MDDNPLFVDVCDLKSYSFNLFLSTTLITFFSFYKVGVHIADVTHFITPGTALDDEAGNRGTTVYLTDKVIRTFDSIIYGMT